MKLNKLLTILMLLLFVGCDKAELDVKLNFIGDSIVARWPLSETFPAQYVTNYGVSGSGVQYMESLGGRFQGETVVIEMGTNDNILFVPEYVEDYVERYVKAVCATGAKTIYLYSVLPREFRNDSQDVNARIRNFNMMVAERVRAYDNIIYIDVYGSFVSDSHINYQYYSDGLHLNIYGYEVMAKALLDVLKD